MAQDIDMELRGKEECCYPLNRPLMPATGRLQSYQMSLNWHIPMLRNQPHDSHTCKCCSSIHCYRN